MMKTAIITTCFTIMMLTVFAAVASASTGGDFTIYPTYLHDGNRNWIITDASPGDTIHESVTLENLSDHELDISLFVREANDNDGKFTVKAPGENHNIGNWINSGINSYTLDAGQKLRVPVTISIPQETAEGEYTAAVFASATARTEDDLNIVTQIGVRVYLTVNPGNSLLSSIFAIPSNGNSLFFYLSSLGLFASVLFYFYEKKQRT